MFQGFSADEERGRSEISGGSERSPGDDEAFEAALVFLNAKEHEAEAGEDDEKAELEVLASAEELVPCPDALSDGHGEDLDRDDEQEDAAETHRGSRSRKECVQAGPGGNGKLDHA